MKYRAFRQSTYFCTETNKEKTAVKPAKKDHEGYDTLEEAINDAENFVSTLEENKNLFISVHTTNNDNKRTFGKQKHIFIDLDKADPKEDPNKYADAITESLGVDCVTVIHSGNGFHVLIELEYPFDNKSYFKDNRMAYNKLLEIIGRGLAKEGLKVELDPNVFCPARMVRMPYSINAKKGKEKPVRIIKKPSGKPIKFINDIVGEIRPEIDITDTISMTGMNHMGWKPHTDAIQEKCGFIKNCKENPAQVKEPQWYALLSILSRAHEDPSEARKLCHEYSKGHPEYDPIETDDKIDQAIHGANPRTCDNIDLLYEGCRRCPQSVHSPIMLKDDDFIKSSETGFRQTDSEDAKITGVKVGRVVYEDLLEHFNRMYKPVSDGINVYKFNETYYEEMKPHLVNLFCQQNVRIPSPTSPERKEFGELVKLNNVKDEEFFASSSLKYINLKNGVLDLKTHKLEDNSDGKYFFTYQMPYEYDPEATCPNFDQFLEDITLGCEDKQKLLLEFYGYVLCGIPISKVAKGFLLLGEGANGKSTYLNVLKEMLSEQAYSTVGMNKLNDDTTLLNLKHKLLNYNEETPPTNPYTQDIIKTLIDGGTRTVRRAHSTHAEQLRNEAVMVWACNKLFKNTDTSYGFFRRLVIVNFNAKFDDATANKEMLNILLKERSGILNRAIEAGQRLIKNGYRFTEVQESKDALEAYRIESDPLSFVDDFLEENDEGYEFTGNADDFVPSDELASTLVSYARQGYGHVSKKSIQMRLKEMSTKATGYRYKPNQGLRRICDGVKRSIILGIRKV